MEKEVKQILYIRRINAETIAEKHMKTALESAEFRKAFAAEKNLIIAQARQKAYGETPDIAALNASKQATDTALKKLGLTRSDITPNYACKKCCDTGIVDNKVCDCVDAIAARISMQKNNLRSLKTFADADMSVFGESSDVPKLYDLLRDWASKTDSPKKVVLLGGGAGAGKTFLMECVASAMFQAGAFVVVKSAFELVSDCLKFHTSFEANKQDLLAKYFDCDALFIDDLGSEPIYKNVSLEYLYLILERRLRAGKRTIITTNLDAGGIRDVYGERIFSRIFNKQLSIPYFFKNKDLRL
ncbi:MAG: ATP-binding protein [Clostridia bacterium]|nr:ATP-binding protein [Clostridia bacterium]